jgi:phage shock protein A
MKIFSRLADLLKANINDLIDRAEDPEKMVKQIIIDMEEQLQRAVQGLGTVMASERQMEKQLNKSREESEMWEKRAKDALEAGDEELAKKALAKKLDADEDVKQYEDIHEGISKQLSVLRGQVDILKEKLVEARTRQSMIIARDKVAEARKEVASAVGDLDSSGVFAKMDKMERKVAEKEAQADAAYDISGLEESEEDPFEKMENKKALDDELARLKKEISKE